MELATAARANFGHYQLGHSTKAFTHVTGTFNPTTRAIKIYVNGIEARQSRPRFDKCRVDFDSFPPCIGRVFRTAGISILPFTAPLTNGDLQPRSFSFGIEAIVDANAPSNASMHTAAVESCELVSRRRNASDRKEQHATLQNGLGCDWKSDKV